MIRLCALCFLLTCLGTAFAAEPCKPIDGLEPLLKPGRILLLGELHGTNESPAFLLDVACHAAHVDLPIVVGLELRSGMQSGVDAFLDSKGTPNDRTALLSGPQWQWDYQDGRASAAMLEMIDGVRRLRAAGKSARIVMFDESGSGGGQSRERAMAANLAAAAGTTEDAVMIVLAGNHHSRITVGSPRSATYEPMGYLVGKATSFERIVSLNVAHGDGSAWICSPECGVNRLGGKRGDKPWTIEIDEKTRPAGHQGWYHVGPISASLPARFSSEEVQQAMSVVESIRRATEAKASAPSAPSSSRPARPAGDDSPLSEAETKIQGEWQAYDYASKSKIWKISFEGRQFHAEGGTDDWYKGTIAIRPDESPAHMDFSIEACQCSYVDETSRAIFDWEGEELVISAPTPGSSRPKAFAKNSGSMMKLFKLQ